MISETIFFFSLLSKHFYILLVAFCLYFFLSPFIFSLFFFIIIITLLSFVCLEFSRNPPKIYVYTSLFFLSFSRFLRAYLYLCILFNPLFEPGRRRKLISVIERGTEKNIYKQIIRN